MEPRQLRQQLRAVRNGTAGLHKALLEQQRQLQEKKDERNYSAGDLLQLSIHHPDFFWLGELSRLIVRLDDVIDEELIEDVREEGSAVCEQLRSMFVEERARPEFKSHLERALSSDPTLHLEVAKLRRTL